MPKRIWTSFSIAFCGPICSPATYHHCLVINVSPNNPTASNRVVEEYPLVHYPTMHAKPGYKLEYLK
jgi:hypothetical protein